MLLVAVALALVSCQNALAASAPIVPLARTLAGTEEASGTTAPRPSPSPAPGTGRGQPRNPAVDSLLAQELQLALDRARRAGQVPGLTLAVRLPDGKTWSGASDLRTAEPATPHTLFTLASVSKPFIAALTLRLAEDGVLNLDDPLSRWVDGVTNGDRITIRHLLGHTSGVRDLFGEDRSLIAALMSDPERRWRPQEVLAYVGAPYWEPGTGWAYSNSNYLLLGMVIERATGGTVGEALRELVLDPLALEDTFLQPDEVPRGALANGHSHPADTLYGRAFVTTDQSEYRPDAAWASSLWTAGGMVSSADDLVRWTDALFGGRVLEDGSLDVMLRVNPHGDYGLGVARKELGGRTAWGHSGMLRGFTTLMLHFPREDISLVVLANQDRANLDDVLLGRHGGRSLFEIVLGAGRG